MVLLRVLKVPKGYLLMEFILTISIVSMLMLSAFIFSSSYLFSLQNNLAGVLLFSQLQQGQMLAMTRDTDVTFQINHNTFERILPSYAVCWFPFTNQTLELTNKSGLGFTESGHTKYSGTLKINGLTSPAVSLGIGFGKVTLK